MKDTHRLPYNEFSDFCSGNMKDVEGTTYDDSYESDATRRFSCLRFLRANDYAEAEICQTADGGMVVNPSERYDSLFVFYAYGRNVAWKLLKAQVLAESNFKPTAVSSVGAKGLAQFMDSTWAEYSSGDPFNPEHSIEAQAKYMERLIASFDGNVELALAAYNWGIGRVKARLLKHNASKWEEIEPYAPDETKGYVKKIINRYGEYCREI